MFRKVQVFVMMMVLVGLALYYYAEQEGVTIGQLFNIEYPVVRVDGVPLSIEVADTEDERIQGLSGRDSLEPVEGVLFVFPESDYHGIWMKDMRFPIDVIWISEDFRIVGIHEGLTPESYPEVFEPPRPAKYALETAEFFVESFNIEIGDEVSIPERYQD